MGLLKRNFGKGNAGTATVVGGSRLPVAPKRQYMPDELPSTDIIRIFNTDWLRRDMSSGAVHLAVGQATDAMRMYPDQAQFMGVARALAEYVQRALGPSAADRAIFQELAYSVALGCGFALLESASGQLRPGLVHPTIWNAMVLSQVHGQNEEVDPAFHHSLNKAREGGYVATRHQLPPEVIFRRCDFASQLH